MFLRHRPEVLLGLAAILLLSAASSLHAEVCPGHGDSSGTERKVKVSGSYTINDGKSARYSFVRIYNSTSDIVYETEHKGIYKRQFYAFGLLLTRQAIPNHSAKVPMKFEVTYSPNPETIMEMLSEEPQLITKNILVDGKYDIPVKITVKVLRRELIFLGPCFYDALVVQFALGDSVLPSTSWTRVWYSPRLRVILKREEKESYGKISIVRKYTPDAISVTAAN